MSSPGPIGPLGPVTYPELHASLGFGMMMAFRFLLPAHWFWWAFLVREVVLLVKESVFDPLVEGPTQPFLWEGVKDFLWYHAGDAVFWTVTLA